MSCCLFWVLRGSRSNAFPLALTGVPPDYSGDDCLRRPSCCSTLGTIPIISRRFGSGAHFPRRPDGTPVSSSSCIMAGLASGLMDAIATARCKATANNPGNVVHAVASAKQVRAQPLTQRGPRPASNPLASGGPRLSSPRAQAKGARS
jgi:hypothetical protein